jgi:hypothetical protein
MKQVDFKRFSMSLMAMSELYGKSVSEGAVLLWWKALEGFDIEQVEQAFAKAVQNPEGGQFMPKPADLIREMAGTKTDRARIAWSKAFDAMQRVGAYQSVAFDDAVIHAVIEDLGGWTKVCRSDLNELSYLEHRFCEAYRAYSGRPDMVYPAKLIGEYEAQNRIDGRKVSPPMLIGDPQKASDVLRLGSTAPKTQFTLASDVMPAMQLEGKQA